MLTLAEMKEALPTHLRSAATTSLLAKVNSASADPEEARTIRENFISYTSVLMEGRFKTEDYVNAITYASFKLMGHTNQESYKRTFPKRYQALSAKGATDKEISAYVAGYNKTKLVALVLEQSLIPTWLLNADIYQEAINAQFRLMTTANSELVQTQAANSILTHLKRPETKKIDISLGAKDNSGLNDLRDAMTSLAHQQQQLIAQGKNTKEIAHHKLVQTELAEEAELVEDKPSE